MALSGLQEELQELSKLKNNWHSIADAIETYRWRHTGHKHVLRRVKETYEAAGFSQNTINRMLAAKAFFDSVKDGVDWLKGIDPNALSFPSLEIVKRLHQVNPDEGLEMLHKVAKGEITFRALREHYDKLIAKDSSKASAHQISKREGAEFESAALRWFSKEASSLFGAGGSVGFHTAAEMRLPLSISAIAERTNSDNSHNGLKLYGLEFFYFRDEENYRKRIEPFLQRVLFNSKFFTSVWVALPSELGEKRVAAFIDILDLSNTPSIGVVAIQWREERGDRVPFKIHREPIDRPLTDPKIILKKYAGIQHRLVYADEA